MAETVSLHFLGTGTSQGVPVIGCRCAVCSSDDPRDKRLRSSVLIRVGEVQVVIDTGPDFRQQMLRSGTERIDAVLFTHEHADHIMGLDDIRAINFQQHMDMPLYVTERVEKAIRHTFGYAFSEKPYPGVPMVHFRTIGNDPFEVNGMNVIPIRADHAAMPVTGFRFGDLTYLTDIKSISREELAKVKGSKVVVLNALRIEEHHSHLNLSEALELMAEIAPERGYFTHISHLLGRHVDVEGTLPPHLRLAFDGMTVSC